MTASIRRRFPIALCALLGLAVVSGVGDASAAVSPVGLGNAGSYAVLAGTTVTNTGPSTVRGDLGVSPGTAVTGFPPGVVSNGVIHAADAAALSAQAALVTAFDDAAGRSSTSAIAADLAGMTLTEGVYTGGALALSGTLTLDAQGDPNAVFVFQAASTLVVNSSSRVSLVNGAGSCNVFWKVGSSATIGTSSVFVGSVLALTSIAAQTNASIEGRLLARNGAVTLDSNTFTRASCQTSPTTPSSATPTSAPVGGAGGGSTPAGGNTSVSTIPGVGTETRATLAGGTLALLLGAMAIAVARRPSRRTRGY